jgi:hypothetical protein
MPQQAQADPVEQFQALPPDKQKEMFEKLSPQARTALVAKVKAKAASKPAKAAEPELPGFTKRLAQSTGVPTTKAEAEPTTIKGIPTIPGSGISMATGYAKNIYEKGKEFVEHPGLGTGLRAAMSVTPAGGLQQSFAEDVAAKNYPGAAGTAAGVAAQVLLPEVLGSLEKGIPPSLTKAATKPVVQKFLFDRSMKVKDQIQATSDAFHAEVGQRWQHLEKTIDEAKPGGSIDVGGLRAEAQAAVKDAIKVPQRLPETVKTIQSGTEPPKVFGEKLDLSKPAHKALYERLKEEGAIPEDRDVITFAEARQLRSKLGRELHSGVLSGEATSVGWKVYGDLTDAMSKSAAEHNMAGAFADANRLHAQYMEDFVNRKSPLTKATRGNNPHEIMGPLSDPRYAEQARRIMAKYQKHGLDPATIKQISKEGTIFQKLKTGLPEQLRYSRFELAGDVLGVGLPVTGARLGYNWAKRAGAIGEVSSPLEFERPQVPSGSGAAEESNVEMERRGAQPPQAPRPSSNTAEGAARHAQALKAASEKLGPKASVRELLAEADRIERGMQ